MPTRRQDIAIDWLEEALKDGPVRSLEIRMLATENHIGQRALDFACGYLKVIKRKQEIGADQYWEWVLPGIEEGENAAYESRYKERMKAKNAAREEDQRRREQARFEHRFKRTIAAIDSELQKPAENRTDPYASDRARYNSNDTCECGHPWEHHHPQHLACYACTCEKFIPAIPETHS